MCYLPLSILIRPVFYFLSDWQFTSSLLVIMKPVGFCSLPFSFLADMVSRNRTFGRHMGLPLAEGLEMISRYVWQHLLSRFRFIPSNHLCFIT